MAKAQHLAREASERIDRILQAQNRAMRQRSEKKAAQVRCTRA